MILGWIERYWTSLANFLYYITYNTLMQLPTKHWHLWGLLLWRPRLPGDGAQLPFFISPCIFETFFTHLKLAFKCFFTNQHFLPGNRYKVSIRSLVKVFYYKVDKFHYCNLCPFSFLESSLLILYLKLRE